MIFTMNGKKSDAATDGRTMGDILAELDERAEAAGEIIIEVRMDGKSLKPDELADASNMAASGKGLVELVAEPAADMKARALETLLELVGNTTEALESGDADSAIAARDAWADYERSFAGLFSAEEGSFFDAFADRLKIGTTSPRSEMRQLAATLATFFGERLAELRDPAGAMLASARIFDAIQADLSEVPVRLQTGKDAQAMHTVVLAIELINKMVRIMPEYMRTLSTAPIEVGGATMPEYYGALTGVLKELAEAFENKDGVLIGDLAEYEIRPRLASFFQVVRTATVDA